MLVNCDPFVQSTTGQTSRKTLQPNDIDTIAIYISGGSISDDLTKTCSVKVYDVNEPSIEILSNVKLTLEKAKVCIPNKTFADGNIIKRCNADGSAIEVVQTCPYGVITDDKSNWICAKPLESEKKPFEPERKTDICQSSADCPKYSACDLATSKCFKCSDQHCCQPGKIWSDSKQACANPTEVIGYPQDTSCQAGWPNKQGGTVFINEQNYACDLFEVKDSRLLSIAEETAQCFSNKCQSSSCHSFCNQAYKESGAPNRIDSNSFKKFAGLYIIYGLGPSAKFMKSYFSAEINCNTAGTGTCSPKDGYNINVQQLQCRGTVGQPHGWVSDADMSKNSCIFSDLPAHASVNILQTGTCVDYSIALTSLLRLVGYTKDEVYSVGAPCHEYNIVKFPGDTKWTIVDTVGNSIALGDTWSWECGGRTTLHCDFGRDECSNDAGQITCPQKSEVFGC